MQYDRQMTLATQLHRLPIVPTPLKEVTRSPLFIAEHRRRKQLRGFRLMPFAEKFGVLPDIIHNIREPPRVERPRPQVAHDLRFYLPDNLTPLFSQISAQVLRAER